MTMLANLVLETASSPGVGDFVLNGAAADRRAFSQAFPSGGRVFYFADDGTQAEWGVGTLTIANPCTLARSRVMGNTFGGSDPVRFSGGVQVYNETPAEFLALLDEDGRLLVDSVTVSREVLVPSVGDWKTAQAVGAAEADGRYLRSAGDQQIVSSPVTFNNGLSATGGISNWASDSVPNAVSISAQFLAKSGPLQETSSPTTFGNGLTSSKNTYLSSVSPLPGASDITINAGLRMGASVLYLNNLASDGSTDLKVAVNLRLGSSVLYVNRMQLDGAGPRTIAGDTNVTDQWSFAQSPKVSGTPVALTSDLPMDSTKKLVEFQVANVATQQRINFTEGFRNPPRVWLTAVGASGNYQVITVIPSEVDVGGFTTHNFSSVTMPYLNVLAIGDR